MGLPNFNRSLIVVQLQRCFIGSLGYENPTNSAKQIDEENAQNGDGRMENCQESHYDDVPLENLYDRHYEGLEEGGSDGDSYHEAKPE